jgi:hypothetical protein
MYIEVIRKCQFFWGEDVGHFLNKIGQQYTFAAKTRGQVKIGPLGEREPVYV